MARRRRRSPIALGLPLLAFASVGCHAKNDAFYARIFPCDPAAPQAECGTSQSGQPLACYDARQLGGQSVCTELCGDEGEGQHGDYACLASGVHLQFCRPTASKHDPTQGCPAGLSCLRTDLLRDEGLCMAVPVCTTDADCRDSVRPRCAGALLREIYPDAPLLRTDNLQCVADRCLTGLTMCPSGESCVATLGLTTSDVPDICVPNCDGNMRCPPNFVCSRVVSGNGAPLLCVPGLPGNRCTSNLDCILGDCVDTGEGFNICTIPCFAHQDCVPLINAHESFMCVPNVADSGKHCATETPFSGSPCQRPTDCPEGTDCFLYSAYGPRTIGECRPPCDAAGRCRVRGGIPNVCLAGGAGGCYPGRFGLPCQDSAECMTDFACLAVPEDPDLGTPAANICTRTCQTDADCDADPWTQKVGYCSAGFCRLGGGDLDPCLRDQHCRNEVCDVPVGGSAGTCHPTSVP
jgi:hypothetical protein